MSAEQLSPRGLRARILRQSHRPNADSVISGNPDIVEVLLVGPEIPEIHRAGENRPLVILDSTAPGYTVARPAQPRPAGRNGYMASGAYIVHSSCWHEWQDVFGHALPIPLHDYTEKVEFNDLIAQSSLGTPGAVSLRARTPREVVDRIVKRVAEGDETS